MLRGKSPTLDINSLWVNKSYNMTGFDRAEITNQFGLAAGADEFGKDNREPGLSVEQIKLELRSWQFDRHRAIMSRVHEALFAGQIRNSEAIDYLTRIRKIGDSEFGSDLATEWFGREPDLPTRRDFEQMIEDFERHPLPRGNYIVTGLDLWKNYSLFNGRMIGAVDYEAKSSGKVNEKHSWEPIIHGSLNRGPLPSHDHEREYHLVANQENTMRFDGNHIFGTVRTIARSQPILPYIDGVIIDRIEGKEIQDGRIVGVSERGWTGTCRVAGDDFRTLPVVDGHIIDQVEGRTINHTSLVGPVPTGRLNSLVNLSDVEMRRVVVEGRIFRIGDQETFIPTGTSDDRPHLLFHHGTVSGKVCIRESSGSKKFMTIAYGQPLEEIVVGSVTRNLRHPAAGLEHPHLDQGLLCGSVRFDQLHSLPMIDGVVHTHLQGNEVQDVLEMEVINGKISGIFMTPVRDTFFMIDGRVVDQVDGRRIVYGKSATCHNVAGTFNGMAYFEDERDPNGRLGPIHKFVLGKRVK